MKKAIIIPIILATAYTARADYHYASHDGSNEYPYTSWATAANIIQDALDAASPGDTAYIDTGDWYETVTVGQYDSIGVIGMGTDSTFWRYDGFHVPILTLGDGCVLEDITFEHTNDWKCVLLLYLRSAKINRCGFIKSRIGLDAGGAPNPDNQLLF